MAKTIILTGTCGSGKTTISKLLASKLDWIRISEDDIWKQCFGKDGELLAPINIVKTDGSFIILFSMKF